MNNKDISNKTANYFKEQSYSEKPELAILNYLKNHHLDKMCMLDIGIGGGRTTEFFCSLVKEYIGIDYASAMVDICKVKFKNKITNGYFAECSVCDMEIFECDKFDFILFSFNGLDYLDYNERLMGLEEIYRVLKPNGFFCFSTHNIGWNNLYNCFKYSLHDTTLNPIKYSYHLLVKGGQFFRVRLANKSIFMKTVIDNLRKQGYGAFYDGPFSCKLKNHYISHCNQIKQLSDLQFKNIKAYSMSGVETDDEKELNKWPWIYYLVRK